MKGKFREVPRIIFNDDAQTMLYGAPPPHNEESVHAAVDYLKGRRIEEARITRSVGPEGRIPSQFILSKHELVTIAVPASDLKFGENTIAFHIPRYPAARDPYVYIHELTVDPRASGHCNTREVKMVTR